MRITAFVVVVTLVGWNAQGEHDDRTPLQTIEGKIASVEFSAYETSFNSKPVAGESEGKVLLARIGDGGYSAVCTNCIVHRKEKKVLPSSYCYVLPGSVHFLDVTENGKPIKRVGFDLIGGQLGMLSERDLKQRNIGDPFEGSVRIGVPPPAEILLRQEKFRAKKNLVIVSPADLDPKSHSWLVDRSLAFTDAAGKQTRIRQLSDTRFLSFTAGEEWMQYCIFYVPKE